MGMGDDFYDLYDDREFSERFTELQNELGKASDDLMTLNLFLHIQLP